jgi:hypothetical protein
VNVSEQLAQAWADVEAAGLPEHVQATALVEALRLRSIGGVTIGSNGGGSSTPAKKAPAKKTAAKGKSGPADPSTSPPQDVDEDAFYAAIERETGVSVDDLEAIIFVKDGGPHINAPRRMLGDTLKQSQANVATLIAVARHFGLGETEVPDSAIREECQRLGVFDRNFAANVKGISGILQTGDRNKVFKIRNAATATFTAAVAAVSGNAAGTDT